MQVPEALVEQIARGNGVVFVGAGLSLGAGLPSWPGLLSRMLDWSKDNGIELADWDELERYIKAGELLLTAEEMHQRLGRDDFRRFMVEIFRRPELRPTNTQLLLPEIPFRAVLTSNYDTLLESAYATKQGAIPPIFTHKQYPELSAALRSEAFYILKVHGTIDNIETIVLGRSDYRDVIFANQAYRHYLTTLFATRAVLFVGFGMSDPDLLLLLDELRSTFQNYTGKHYALMNVYDVSGIKQKRFERDYGLQIISYEPSQSHPEVHEFLRALRDQVKQAQSHMQPMVQDTTAGPSTEISRKSQLTLQEKEGTQTIMKVTLLYKRYAQPDENILRLLESQLRAAGHEVFIDRHLTIGMEWAKEIEQQIRSSDAIIPLLSAASVQSEMLAWEVNIACEAAQKQDGKPRLLPVRLSYDEPLPNELANVLKHIEYALWQSDQDNQRLVDQLLYALQNPTPVTLSFPREKLEWPVGAVPMDSQFYLVRPTDKELHDAMVRQDSIVLIKGARQMGKTSLLARGLQQARQLGHRVVLTDFQKLNEIHLESLETVYLALGRMIADQLDLDILPENVWQNARGPNDNFERYLRREVLSKVPTPLVWGLDEVDRLFTYPFSNEVFSLLRSWHNERALNPDGPWCRLTLAIAYATEAYLFITDMNQSPFNVGTRIILEDFTFEQVVMLNYRYGLPLHQDVDTMRFFRLVSGQPYLVRRGLHEMVMQDLDIDAFEEQADKDEGLYGDHLRRILILLAQNADLCHATREVLEGRPCPDPQLFHRLRSAGVLAGDSLSEARPRCHLYAAYLKRHL